MASTRLNMPNGVDASATAITVHVNRMMPQAPFYCTFETGETIKVTTGSGLLDQWTIERGALNTIARAHANDEWLTVSIGHEQALAAELATTSDATTTMPGVMLADVTPSGAHPVALTKDGLSGVASDEANGITVDGQLATGHGNSIGLRNFTVLPDGSIVSGDPGSSTYPNNIFYGYTEFDDTVAQAGDGERIVLIKQLSPLSGDSSAWCLGMRRDGVLNGWDYTQPMIWVDDSTASAAPLAQFIKGPQTQFQIDGDGIQVHGKFKTGASVAHALGSYSGNAIPIYDEAGTLLGYAPLYS